MATPYARERLEGHRLGVDRALAAGPEADARALRNLAVDADRSTFLAPVSRSSRGPARPGRRRSGGGLLPAHLGGGLPHADQTGRHARHDCVLGDERVSTALVPTIELSPTVTPRRMQAP